MKKTNLPLLSPFISSDKYTAIPLIVTLISIAAMTAIIAYLMKVLPQNVPLFYSLPWGSTQLVNKTQLFLLPIIPLSIGIINFILYSQLHHTQIILKRMLLLSIFVVNIIVIVALLKIIGIYF